MATETSIKVTNGKVVIEIPYNPKSTYPMSNTGKSHMVYSTGGFQAVGDTGLKISLNLIKVLPK